MRIGIDIDNTLTDIKEKLEKAAYDYAISLGKKINLTKHEEDPYNDGNIYRKKYKFNDEELMFFFKNIQESIANNAKPRHFVVKALKLLKKQGNEIYIITARDYEFHDDPYLYSKNWLDKNKIVYDKIIVNARHKAGTCLENHIDVFIDDHFLNCKSVLDVGIPVIRIADKKSFEEYPNLISLSNWKSIYNYLMQINLNKILI